MRAMKQSDVSQNVAPGDPCCHQAKRDERRPGVNLCRARAGDRVIDHSLSFARPRRTAVAVRPLLRESEPML